MIVVECSSCSAVFKLRSGLAGQTVRCALCGGVIDVPLPSQQRPTVDRQKRERRARAPQKPRNVIEPIAPEPPRRASQRPADDFPVEDFEDYESEDSYGELLPVLPPVTGHRRREETPRVAPKRNEKKEKKELDPHVITTLIAVWLIILGVILAFVVPVIGQFMGPVLAVIGGAFMLASQLAMIMVAFEEDFHVGLLYLFIPFFALYFICTRFEETRFALLTTLAGLVMLLIGLGLQAALAAG